MVNASKILNEYNASLNYMIKRDCTDNRLVELSLDNVAKVEAIMRASFAWSSDKLAAPTATYHGSLPYWMAQFRSYSNGEETPYTYEYILENCINAVDRENSTHLNADHCGREIVKHRLLSLGDDKALVTMLKDSTYPLIGIIAARTTTEKRGRVNFSFASKFCHYLCFYLFEGEPEQDMYSIYDTVLSENLIKYAKHYGVTINGAIPTRKLLTPNEENLSESYSIYQKMIADIITASGNLISRNGLDHLLWFSHKNDNYFE